MCQGPSEAAPVRSSSATLKEPSWSRTQSSCSRCGSEEAVLTQDQLVISTRSSQPCWGGLWLQEQQHRKLPDQTGSVYAVGPGRTVWSAELEPGGAGVPLSGSTGEDWTSFFTSKALNAPTGPRAVGPPEMRTAGSHGLQQPSAPLTFQRCLRCRLQSKDQRPAGLLDLW